MKEKIEEAIICKLNAVIEFGEPIDPMLPTLIDSYYKADTLDIQEIVNALQEVIAEGDDYE